MERTITLKTISDSHQYPQLVEWYYSTDPISHELGYGRFAKKIITAHLAKNSPLIEKRFLHGIYSKQKLVGFLIIYPATERFLIEQKSNDDLKKHMNRLSYLRKLQFYQKVARILSAKIAEDSYYIHSLVIDTAYQGQGIGTAIIEKLTNRYDHLSLHVNEKNDQAVKFYLKNGFKIVHHGQIRYQGDFYGEYLMQKETI